MSTTAKEVNNSKLQLILVLITIIGLMEAVGSVSKTLPKGISTVFIAFIVSALIFYIYTNFKTDYTIRKKARRFVHYIDHFFALLVAASFSGFIGYFVGINATSFPIIWFFAYYIGLTALLWLALARQPPKQRRSRNNTLR